MWCCIISDTISETVLHIYMLFFLVCDTISDTILQITVYVVLCYKGTKTVFSNRILPSYKVKPIQQIYPKNLNNTASSLPTEENATAPCSGGAR